MRYAENMQQGTGLDAEDLGELGSGMMRHDWGGLSKQRTQKERKSEKNNIDGIKRKKKKKKKKDKGGLGNFWHCIALSSLFCLFLRVCIP